MNEELIKSLRDHPSFAEFQDYLGSKIAELTDVSDLQSLSNERAGEEVKVRSRAAGKLMEILKPLLDYRERRDPTIAEIQKSKDRYAL